LLPYPPRWPTQLDRSSPPLDVGAGRLGPRPPRRRGVVEGAPEDARRQTHRLERSRMKVAIRPARPICNFLGRLREVKDLISLATPPGFEPGTFSLEGPWSRNDFNARSDIFTVRAPFDAIAEFRFVGTPTSRLPPPNARRRRARRTRRLGGSTSSLQFAGVAS
jgi:hypothetical protein